LVLNGVPLGIGPAEPTCGSVHEGFRKGQVLERPAEEDRRVSWNLNKLQRRHKEGVRFATPGCPAVQEFGFERQQEPSLLDGRLMRDVPIPLYCLLEKPRFFRRQHIGLEYP
jgi:hypothetical protein